MAFSRFAALRSSIRAARPTAAKPRLFRQVVCRGYASGGHEPAKSGGDAVWAAGAVVVTVSSCWWILSNASDTSHGHGDHGDGHGEEHGETHHGETGEESEEEEAKEKSDDAEKQSDETETKSNDGDESEESDRDEDKTDAPETSDDDSEEESGDGKNTKTTTPDAKGGIKKRLESNKAIKAGETDSEDTSDKAAASKPTGDKNSQTSKQEGLTNTDTKHSTDITNDPSKSKKGEGAPETAKVKGTVDPNRPQSKKE